MFPHINVIFRYLLLYCLLFAARDLYSQNRPEPLFQFGVIADVQYADRPNNGTRHYRASLAKLKEAVTVFNKENVKFVISLGDFINDQYQSFDTLTAITDNLSMPLHHVVGNHEFSVGEEHKKNVLPALNLKHSYYAFTKKKWRFILLNGNDISVFANDTNSVKYQKAKDQLQRLKKSGAANAHPWNGTLGTEQLEWLTRQLLKAQKKNQAVLVFCHFPLYPDGSSYILWDSPKIRAVVEAYPIVKAWLNGHVHKSQYFKNNEVHYVTFRGMVEEEKNAFAIVSLFKDHLEIKGYGAEVDRILK